ncbi:MAG: wax ester/triacylglycerol synthase family O-acyltransferase [Solirubrobacterales bacterium]|nr:wax ester/triacylglycerol synthase family O-acyltransferase [Solirubrobacterales bacterium]
MPMRSLTCTPPAGASTLPHTDGGAPPVRPDPLVFTALATFDVPLHAAHVRGLVRDRVLPQHPRLAQMPDDAESPAGRRRHDAPAFDLDLHVHRRALHAPGDRRALWELVAAVISLPLDHGRPRWDLTCVDGLRAGGALVARLDQRLVPDAKAFVDALVEQLGGHREVVVPSPVVEQGCHRG